jgi:hypothetical protein
MLKKTTTKKYFRITKVPLVLNLYKTSIKKKKKKQKKKKNKQTNQNTIKAIDFNFLNIPSTERLSI